MEFVTDVFTEEESDVIVYGVDCPPSLREASQLVEPFDLTQKRNFLEDKRIHDAGEVGIGGLGERVKAVLERGKIPLVLAKEHTVTMHIADQLSDECRIVVFDAHPDLKDEYEGSKTSHACWARRVCERFGCKKVAFIGVRSCDEDELNYMDNNGVVYFTAEQIREDIAAVKEGLDSFVGQAKAYVSLDMDVFDPSIAPAVKYPEPGGITYQEFVSLIGPLKDNKIIGMDCVELRPILGNRITEFLAVKSMFHLLSFV